MCDNIHTVLWTEAGQETTMKQISFENIDFFTMMSTRSVDISISTIDHALVALKRWIQGQQQRCFKIFESADKIDNDAAPAYIDIELMPDLAVIVR